MRLFFGSACLGVFTWLSYLVLTDKVLTGNSVVSDYEFFFALVERLNELMGSGYTALAFLSFGAVLTFGIIAFGPRSDEY